MLGPMGCKSGAGLPICAISVVSTWMGGLQVSRLHFFAYVSDTRMMTTTSTMRITMETPMSMLWSRRVLLECPFEDIILFSLCFKANTILFIDK
jgi:hypothetical protein